VPLNLESALFMLKSYDPDLWHRIVFARDLDRDALLAKERERRRWPNGPPQTTSQINEASSSPPVAAVKTEKETPADSPPKKRSSTKG
jgi:hypothetical protein